MTSVTTDRRFGVNGNLAVKAPVRVATTANITLSGLQTIDGVALAEDDRVLVKDQTTGSENGIYVAGTGSWTRSIDANGNRDLAKGTTVFVNSGTSQGGVFYHITSADPIVIGTSAISFAVTSTTLSEIQSIASQGIDVTVPRLGIGLAAVISSMLVIQQNTSNTVGDGLMGNTVQIQRIVNDDEGITNPHALRAYTKVNIDTTQTEWALSAELDNYSDTSGGGNTASSGVANKYGLAVVFGGHFQAKDHNTYAAATDVTSLVGVEINTPCIGVDHPTANAGLGNRFCMDIIARALNGVGASAETGCAIRIRPDGSGTSNGYFRVGIAITEQSKGANPNVIGQAILISTAGTHGINMAGAHTTADIVCAGNSANGLILNGTYTGSAIRVASGNYVALSTDGAIKCRYNSTANYIEFYNGATRVGYIDMAGADHAL